MLNPDVDGYTKTLNHRKILQKRKKQHPTENQKIPSCPPPVTPLSISAFDVSETCPRNANAKWNKKYARYGFTYMTEKAGTHTVHILKQSIYKCKLETFKT